MRKALLAAGALSIMLGLSACGGGYGYYGASVGEPDVYYDGFYGPYTDGYWADEGFYYRGGDGRFIRDEHNHFQRRMFNGAHGFHAHGRPAGDHDRDHH